VPDMRSVVGTAMMAIEQSCQAPKTSKSTAPRNVDVNC
jgi:hypothetical protein